MISEPLIAIVDDDDGMRASLDALVRSLGYRTTTFDAAERLLGSEHIGEAGCVISDIEMPGGMDGIALTMKLLATAPARPVILVSAYVTDRIRTAAMAAGAFAVLKKPFVGETLIEAIESALPK
ncbi:response regulator [Rhizobium gallicum]|uniref:response regulator n=1 Tax=Rhizobium gallicum TaxID=56730 RepID=UPI001EF90A44|nr:response regulator [Rhizobium gallicum]ULJ75784.1 response regulator [Rhizobium gallicum]